MILACKACGQKNRLDAAKLDSPVRCGKCKTAITPVTQPLDADAALFDEVVNTSPVPVLVDFWAAWCGPCRTAAPEVARVAVEMAGRAIVLKVDTEAHPALAGRFGVRSIPTFLVLRGGRVVRQQPGVVSHTELQRWLEAPGTQPV